MFKIIADVSYVQYDNAIAEMIEVARKNPQTAKQIPAFINADMIVQMPQEMKNEMLVKALSAEKQKGMTMLETTAARAGVPMRLKDLILEAPNEPDRALHLQLEGTISDYDAAIGFVVPRLLQNEELSEVLGDLYKDGMTVADAMTVMKQQPDKEKEFYIIKTLSFKKDVLKQELSAMAAQKRIELKMGAMKFMLPR